MDVEFQEACRGGDLKTVTLLHSDPRFDISDYYAALVSACEGGHLDVVRYLVSECHVRVNKCHRLYEDYIDALEGALWSGNLDVVRYLISKGARASALLRKACAFGHTKNVCDLASCRPVDINRGNDHGNTALIIACQKGRMDMVKCLVAGGADVNIQNKSGQTALWYALFYRRYDLVSYLVSECGADVNAQDWEGTTALMQACRRSRLSVVKELVISGRADVNARNESGRGALHLVRPYGPIFCFLVRAASGPGSFVPEAWRGA